jgi:hypothetical protein
MLIQAETHLALAEFLLMLAPEMQRLENAGPRYWEHRGLRWLHRAIGLRRWRFKAAGTWQVVATAARWWIQL